MQSDHDTKSDVGGGKWEKAKMPESDTRPMNEQERLRPLRQGGKLMTVTIICVVAGYNLSGNLNAQTWLACGSNICLANANAGIGTTNPSITLQVNGQIGFSSTETASSHATGYFDLNANTSVDFNVAGSTVATLVNAGTNGGSLSLKGSAPSILFGSGNAQIQAGSTGPGWFDYNNPNGSNSFHAGSAYLIEAYNTGLYAINGTYLGLMDANSGNPMWQMKWDNVNKQALMSVSTSDYGAYARGNLLLVAGGNESSNYSHLAALDPTYIIHSRSASGNATNQWISFQHNTASGVIATGVGHLILSPAGNVGIGTTSPQHLLQVAGTIGAQEVIVSATGADYVFAPEYQLARLSEVADYIKANHHLPDIPPAKEVEEKGVNVGEMQSKLLAKIEELTLHMIEADETNRELRERISRLEAGGLRPKTPATATASAARN